MSSVRASKPRSYPLRQDMPPLPKRIAALPVGRNGYPVPWFVAWQDGEPEFRAMDGEKLRLAIKERRCWVCGEPVGREMTFVIGPMCAVNRTSAEPPSHAECADFSARACPFLSRPQMRRREAGMPDLAVDAPGFAIKRNPGVTCLWTTRDYTVFRKGSGVLFKIGDPVKERWYAEGRAASRAEVAASTDSGLPALRELAERESPAAVEHLGRLYRTAMAYWPAEGGES